MLNRGDLERFVDEFGDHAYGFAYSLCGNEADARELVQEAFVRLMDRADRYDPSRSLDSWFMTILKNLYLDGARRWERRNGISLDTPVGEDGLTVADSVGDEREQALLDRLERDEDGARVRAALAALPPQQRVILNLVDVEGAGYEKAAEILGWPIGTVRSRLNRARTSLKRRLTEMGVTA